METVHSFVGGKRKLRSFLDDEKDFDNLFGNIHPTQKETISNDGPQYKKQQLTKSQVGNNERGLFSQRKQSKLINSLFEDGFTSEGKDYKFFGKSNKLFTTTKEINSNDDIEIPKPNPIRKINLRANPSTIKSIFSIPAPPKPPVAKEKTDVASSPQITFKNNYYESSSFKNASQNFRTTEEISSAFRQLFKFEKFNAIQSKCFEIVMHSDMNLILSAPTGSGKTVVMELAIIRLLEKQLQGFNLSSRVAGEFKVVYLAPIKALCQQIYEQWSASFKTIGVKCKELTGDTESFDYMQLMGIDIIITTPEKWDSVTRKWKDYKHMMGNVALLLIDEVHLLNESRGACLEAVVSRMKTIRSDMVNKPASSLRFIALSATVPNIEDVAEWLEVPSEGILKFGEDYRPVKLESTVIGYPPSKNQFIFDRQILEVAKKYGIGEDGNLRSTLVVSTRKGTNQCAQQIAKSAGNSFIRDEEHRNRKIIEEGFLNGDIVVLCTTTTLSQGVNLPAGTQIYIPGTGFQEYSELTIIQMTGRAGRPNFDTSGSAVIMTEESQKRRYESLIHHQKPLESNLATFLTEHLNAEIVLQTINDVSVAIKWLKSTFFYQRCQKNPSFYNMKVETTSEKLDQKLKQITLQVLNELEKYGIISTTNITELKPTELGQIMAKYYIQFETMIRIIEITPNATIQDLVLTLCKSNEFKEYNIRISERKPLNIMNSEKAKMKFPLKGKAKTKEDKLYILLQASLGDIPINDWSLKQDSLSLFLSSPRILRTMVAVLIYKKSFVATLNSILLSQSIKSRIWFDSQEVVRQLDKIGPVLSRSLSSGGVTSFEILEKTDPRKIELLCQKRPPFGTEVLQHCYELPFIEMQFEQISQQGEIVQLRVTVALKRKISASRNTCILIVGTGNDLVFYKRFPCHTAAQLQFSFQYPLKKTCQMIAHLMNEDFVGLDVSSSLMLTSKNPKSIDEKPFRKSTQQTLSPYGVKKIPKNTQEHVQDFIDLSDLDGTLDIPQFALFEEETDFIEALPPPKPVIHDSGLSLLRSKAQSYIPSTPVRRLNNSIRTTDQIKESEHFTGTPATVEPPRRRALVDISILDKWLDEENAVVEDIEE